MHIFLSGLLLWVCHNLVKGFQTSIYASPWFLTMFASVLSLDVSFRVLDLVMVEGKEFLFRVGLALLETSRETLVMDGHGGDDEGKRNDRVC